MGKKYRTCLTSEFHILQAYSWQHTTVAGRNKGDSVFLPWETLGWGRKLLKKRYPKKPDICALSSNQQKVQSHSWGNWEGLGKYMFSWGRGCSSVVEYLLCIRRSWVQFLATPVKRSAGGSVKDLCLRPLSTAASLSREHWCRWTDALIQYKTVSCDYWYTLMSFLSYQYNKKLVLILVLALYMFS